MILHDIFEGKMKEIDIEYQDFLNSRGRNSMSDDEFEKEYGMSRTEWAKRNKEWTWQKERQPVAPDAHLFHEDSEYNDEAGMAHTNLHTTARAVQGLIDTIKDRDNLPEWVQEKIAKAEGMLVTAWDYLLSQKEQGIDPQVDEDWQKVNKKDRTAGMSKKAVKAYRREHPGSKLQTAVTTKPSKLKKGSKASKRRKSYCSRSKGQMKMHNISCRKTPDKAICKARRRWNCEESVAESAMSNLHAELASKYNELAPKIEKYKDSYLASELYDALEAIAINHNAELEFKRMLAGAKNSAHMDYDTNPGGFQNWFWYLPFADDQDVEEGRQTFSKHDPYWVCVNGKKWKRFDTYEHARAVHDRLEKKLRDEGSDKKVSLLSDDDQLDEKQDACYHKVKSRYKVWPSAYASGALVQCRKKGAANWGNKSKE